VNTNANSLTLYALNGASSASISVIGNNTLPLGVTGTACNYSTATTFPGTLSFPGLQSQSPVVNFTSGFFNVSSLPGSCSPQATHFNFNWTYTGWVAKTSNTADRIWVTNATTALVPNNGGSAIFIFEDPSTGGNGATVTAPKLRPAYTYCGSSSGTFNPLSAATAAVTVTNKSPFPGGSSCTLDCFLYTNNTISIAGGAYLPGNGGGDHPEQVYQPFGVPNINLMPNPAPGKFQIQLEGTQEMNGTIEIINASGVVVYKAAVHKSQVDIDLSRKAKGMYSVRWINDIKPVTQTLILE